MAFPQKIGQRLIEDSILGFQAANNKARLLHDISKIVDSYVSSTFFERPLT